MLFYNLLILLGNMTLTESSTPVSVQRTPTNLDVCLKLYLFVYRVPLWDTAAFQPSGIIRSDNFYL